MAHGEGERKTCEMIKRLKIWAKTIKVDVLALWYAARDPRTPRLAKLLALAVTAYAFSPIDLIPDFIPILGYVDDLLIVPLGIVLVIKLIPAELMEEYRSNAIAQQIKPTSRVAALCIVLIWAALSYCLYLWMKTHFPGV